jgi:hypothetical protein
MIIKYKLYLFSFLLIFISCNVVDNNQVADIEKHDNITSLTLNNITANNSGLCEYDDNYPENCDDGNGSNDPNPGIDFDVDNNLYPTSLQVIGTANASTSEVVDYLSIELKLYRNGILESQEEVEAYNTDYLSNSVVSLLESGQWSLIGTATMIDGNDSDTKNINININL